MNQILSLGLSALTVGSHLDFHRAVTGYIDTFTPVALKIETIAPGYIALVARERMVVQRPTAQRYTTMLAELDCRRDYAAGVVMNLIRSHVNTLIDEKRTAALELKAVITPYQGLAKLAYQKESQLIEGMLAALALPANAAHVATLGIADEVEMLEQAQQAFAQMYEKSREDAAQRLELESVDTKELRAKVDAAYQQLVLYVNANALLNPTEELTGFVTKVNGAIYRAQQEADQSHSRPSTGGGTGDGGNSGDGGESPDPIEPGGGDDGGESPDPIV